MLAIRLQRLGRKGHAQYRVIVQDSHRSPKSGVVVAYLGSYNPHTKTSQLDKEKIKFYLDNGAQPSDRVAGILKVEGVKLPKWVSVSAPKKRTTRNPEKRAKAEPAPTAEAPAKEAEDDKPAEEPATEVADTTEAPTEEAPNETPAEEPAEVAAAEDAK